MNIEYVKIRAAEAFNRTILGLGVLLGLYFLHQEAWLKVVYIAALVVLYFILHRRFAPDLSE